VSQGQTLVRAVIPTRLKQEAFAVLAAQELKFAGWLRRQLRELVKDTSVCKEGDVADINREHRG
jgi:hypothetical protein